MADSSSIPGDAVERLLKKGEKQGYLTHADIFDVLPSHVVEELDDLIARLKQHQVALVDNRAEGVKAVTEQKARKKRPTVTDALSSYLREIGQLTILDRETEADHARDYQAGIREAMEAVVEARLFLDELIAAASRVEEGEQNLWEVIDRLRYRDSDEGVDEAKAEFVRAAKNLKRLTQRNDRLTSKRERRGTSQAAIESIAAEQASIREEVASTLVAMPLEPKFLERIARDMTALHSRLERTKSELVELAGRVGIEPPDLADFIKTYRDEERDDEYDIDEIDRQWKNLRRRVRRVEKQAGMSFEKLHGAVLRHRRAMLRANRARDALVLSAQRLVLSSARYYGRRLSGSGMEVADLISAGNLGLIRAVELFDPERGNRFSTFAGHWVRHAMIRTIHTQSRTVYVPPHIRQQMSKILATENELLQRSGRSPTEKELAEACQIDLAKLRHTLQSFGRMSSIDRPLDPDDSGSATFGDILQDNGLTPDQELEGAERRALVRQLADRLQGRERSILFMRMGWNQQEAMTLAEIGEQFGISRQRVEQLEKRALGKLRRWAKAAGLGDPLTR